MAIWICSGRTLRNTTLSISIRTVPLLDMTLQGAKTVHHKHRKGPHSTETCPALRSKVSDASSFSLILSQIQYSSF